MEIRDPIHGMIYVNKHEMEIIDTEEFQRLRNIMQLATTHLVYPGAVHTRFQHSLGTMHLASQVIAHLKQNNYDSFFSDNNDQQVHWAWMEQMLRLIALTHDIGHPPFSHVGEALLPDGRTHLDYTKDILLSAKFKEIISRIGSEFNLLYHTDKFEISSEALVEIYLGDSKTGNGAHILRFLMDSELDCDKMDYLLRDSYYCGVKYGCYDLERLLCTIGLANDIEDEEKKVVVINEDGLHAFEEFVLARYYMFLQVYFHKTRRILDISLDRLLKKILENGVFPSDLASYLDWDDNKVLREIQKHKDIKEASYFLDRQHPRLVYQTDSHGGCSDTETYRRIRAALIKNGICTEKELVEDDANKLPHQIPSTLISRNDESKVVYLLRNDGRVTNIMNASYVLSRIKDSISIHRIYVPLEKRDQTRGFITERFQKSF